MYKILLFVMGLFLCIHASAQQFKITPVAGFTVATRTVQLDQYMAEHFVQTVPYKQGIMAGIGLETKIFTKVALQTDLLYSEFGHTLKSKYGYNLSQSYHLHYITLPVSAKVYITKGAYRPYVLAGGYGSILARAVYSNKDFTGETSSSSLPVGESDAYRYYHRFDYGVHLGTGIALKLGVGELNLEARYVHGLAHTENVFHPIGRSAFVRRSQVQNRLYSVSIGYAIPL
jgi:hypothetical protein